MLRNTVSALCVRSASRTAPALRSQGTAGTTEVVFKTQQGCSEGTHGDVAFGIGFYSEFKG